VVWYAGDQCDNLIQQYNQALQLREDWETEVAAPLRQQIADQQRLIADQQNQIKTLQSMIDSQTSAALQSEARDRAALDFIGACLGVGMALVMVLATFRRLARRSPTPDPELGRDPERGRAASA
jgi:hypothetical protein